MDVWAGTDLLDFAKRVEQVNDIQLLVQLFFCFVIESLQLLSLRPAAPGPLKVEQKLVCEAHVNVVLLGLDLGLGCRTEDTWVFSFGFEELLGEGEDESKLCVGT